MKNLFDFLLRPKNNEATTKSKTQPTFIELFREFNEREALQNSLSLKTQSKYNNFCDNLEAFLKNVDMINITAEELNAAIIEDFRHWLHKNLSSCGLTHSSKHINQCKRVMDYALTKGFVKYNSISFLKTKRDKVKEVVALEDVELKKWVSAKWESSVYQKAQDLYTFQTSSGLSYMDLFSYKTIKDSLDQLWIESVRGKTNKPFYVPLWHKDFINALKIHEKYGGKLPYLHNGAYNRYIKEMAQILGIEKYLTTHTGRKTFATNKDQQGWSTNTIASMLGNTDDVCRNHYVKTSKGKIEAEMVRLKIA
ncbi:MAG: phage integrase SAM-like domain-containing protein [Bacteroidia bacterium]|nr:phage integrase SAM-like domain-containing protein [Bacteroidia bacterium]